MAKSLTKTNVQVDSTDIYLHIFLEGDTGASDWENTSIYDKQDNTGLYFNQITYLAYASTGFSIYLFFEGTPNQKIFYLPQDTSGHFDLQSLPLMNKAASKTGNLLIGTEGVNANTDVGFLLIKGKTEIR